MTKDQSMLAKVKELQARAAPQGGSQKKKRTNPKLKWNGTTEPTRAAQGMEESGHLLLLRAGRKTESFSRGERHTAGLIRGEDER